ncbi:RNA 3'-terminal phosphate cyclase [Pseudomonas anguilliseptica]|uniref:RNA 3'-terminal phosphate cyclase n=1 Tax=Pseudomonas anguilliseptica TaxID=53406 RepID=A0A1H4PGM1_PSEAG|nr:RNA 3'-terminal phosphate cyclase [Pseudomonas anguilliseptica]SEC06583.1 RNA 3'-terminal phosphate cyclase (ATP) [Pseudomonas anguilliseptica]
MQTEFLELDGAIGGGQVLRSALSLSMVSGRPFRIVNIRAQRSRPGLLRQHLTAVLAAAEVCDAQIEEALLGSMSLSFRPGAIKAGDYSFSIGTAGSCTLVLQTLLPALLLAPDNSRLRISGGTHNPAAPPSDFLQQAWLPLLRRMGAQLELSLLRHGFAPAGGGQLELHVQPGQLKPLHLETRGAVLDQQARCLLAGVPGHVGARELERLAKRLNLPEEALHFVHLPQEHGPGNALLLDVRCEHVSELFAAFGQPRLRAENVADQVAKQARDWLGSDTAVAEHLADQLLLPMALAGGGSFTTPRRTAHLDSNIQVIETFMPVRIHCETLGPERIRVSLLAAAPSN